MKSIQLDYKGIFEAGPTLYLILLPDPPRMTIAGASDLYLKTTNKTRDDIVGKGVFEAFPPNPTDQGASERVFRAAFARVIANHQFDVMPIQQYDIPIPPEKGGGFEVRYWSVTHTPVLNEEGTLIHLIQRVEDITELMRLQLAKNDKEKVVVEMAELEKKAGRIEGEVLMRAQQIKEANQKLLESNSQLTELNRIKTEFFSNISHEFRTPITLILGPASDMIGDLSKISPKMADSSKVIYRNALRLFKLVNQLLDFSKIEAGKLAMNYESIDIGNYTRDLCSTFRSAIEKAGLKLMVDCPDVAEQVYVDRGAWEKIVLNLLSNAFKYTLKGEILVKTDIDSKVANLTVSDTGKGIPPEEIEKVFERFYRVPNSEGRTYEGMGIGLALVQELVKLHGGSIHVKSTLNKGTTFTVSIPLGADHLKKEFVSKKARKADPASILTSKGILEESEQWISSLEGQDSPIEDPEASSQEELVNKKSVLVVDDNADMRDYITKTLSKQFKVTTRNNGRQALEVLRTEAFDLVLSDVMMPELDGIGLLETVRKDPHLQYLPFILLSARAGEEAKLSLGKIGADDYLTKPFSAVELIGRIQSNINLNEMRNHLLKQVERSNRDLEAFSYSVAHDLRGPLRGISGFGEILLTDHSKNLGAEGTALLGRIIKASQRMGTLIDGLLSLAKVGRGELGVGQVNLTRLAEDVRQTLEAASPERKVQFNIQTGLVALGDVRLLDLLIQNLVSNSFKFTSKSEKQMIEVGSFPKEGKTVYFVRDTGAGFDMRYVRNLFGVFQRMHSDSDFEGTGIGPAICHKIVQRHGGEIWGEGKVGFGSTFYFTLSEKPEISKTAKV